MQNFLAAQIKANLAEWQIEYLDTDLLTAKAVRSLSVAEDGGVQIHIELGFPCANGFDRRLIAELKARLMGIAGVTRVESQLTTKIFSYAVQQGLTPMPNVKNIIAVASGKGGVGKSTVAVNMALALHAEGANVALLDADIYGPSQPLMLGSKERPRSPDQQTMLPIYAHGLQTMSIGYLIDENEPMIWRGPMVIQALHQLLTQTRWENVDYLIIDLPPGTGDTQLSMAQKVPVAGSLIVTTPQDIALLDAKKGLRMFQKVNVPILGIVENMSMFCCPQCGHNTAIFGEAGGEKMSAEFGVPLLGRLPLAPQIRADADRGMPTVVAAPDSAEAKAYRELALRVAARLSRQSRDYSAKFPKITITNG